MQRQRGFAWLLVLLLAAGVLLLGSRIIRLLSAAIALTKFGITVLILLGFCALILYVVKMSSNKS